MPARERILNLARSLEDAEMSIERPARAAESLSESIAKFAVIPLSELAGRSLSFDFFQALVAAGEGKSVEVPAV
jgi:hypothetical protein